MNPEILKLEFKIGDDTSGFNEVRKSIQCPQLNCPEYLVFNIIFRTIWIHLIIILCPNEITII